MKKTLHLACVIVISSTLSLAQKTSSELQQLITGKWAISDGGALIPKGADSLFNNLDSTEIFSGVDTILTFNATLEYMLGESSTWKTVKFGESSNFSGKDYYDIYLSDTKYIMTIVYDSHLILTRSFASGISISYSLLKQ